MWPEVRKAYKEVSVEITVKMNQDRKKGKAKKKAVVSQSECVACGSCETVCPLNAITIFKGNYAKVDEDICVGCGKCQKACPASVITVEARV